MRHIARRCPICGSDYGEILYTHRLNLPELLKFMPASLDIVCCETCGMIYTSSDKDQDTYNLYYNTLHSYSEDKNTHDAEEDCYNIEIRNMEFEFIKDYIDPSYCVIDIGTGTGGMLTTFQQHGFQNLIGIDIDDKREMIEAKGFKFIQGEIKSLPQLNIESMFSPNASGHNLFILNGVLEHIYDVRSAMLSLADTMKSEDLLFVMVPDADEYLSHFDRPYRYFGMEHINHFNEHMLINLVDYYGFEVLTHGKFDCKHNSVNSEPSLYVLIRKKLIRRDLQGRKNVVAYINKSKETETKTADIIAELANSGKSVIVWGVGSYLMSLYQKTMISEVNIEFFVDNNKELQKSKMHGLKVTSPEVIKDYPECCICIVSAVYTDNILQEIKQMELPNEVIIL